MPVTTGKGLFDAPERNEILRKKYRSSHETVREAGSLDEQLERATGKKREPICTWPDPDHEMLLTTEQKRNAVERRRARSNG